MINNKQPILLGAIQKSGGYLGRLANMYAQPFQASVESPWTSSAIGAPAVVGDYVAPMSGYALGPLSEMLQKRVILGGSDQERTDTLNNNANALKNTSMGGNALKAAKRFALPSAVFGGLAGGATAAAGGSHANIGDILTGAGVGALGGLVGGSGVGAGMGALSKYINNRTSADSQNRSRDMIAKHPYLTSLPFGNLIGAGVA